MRWGYVLRTFLMQALVHKSTRDGAGILEDNLRFSEHTVFRMAIYKTQRISPGVQILENEGASRAALCVASMRCLLLQELKAVAIQKFCQSFHHCERKIAIYSGTEDSVSELKGTKRASK